MKLNKASQNHVRASARNQSLVILAVATCVGIASPASAQLLEFERAPISYHDTVAADPISRIQQAINTGKLKLGYDQQWGYLPAMLKALEVPRSSQLLVFSRTSFQIRKISPSRPRAIYFNDESYVGYVQFGDVLEFSTTDLNLGGVFYTLSQEKADRPRFIRDKGQCLACHASSRTKGVPGHLVRSVFPGPSGQPQLGSGVYLSDHTSKFSKRFGGWYITGTHGTMRHMGNAYSTSRNSGEELDREPGANLTDLSKRIDTSRYLQPTSDLVAMMVLEHQTQMHNLITLASMETRAALHYNAVMAKALDRPVEELSESTKRRIASVGDKLVRYLLFDGEFPLEAPVQGVSKFTEEFSKRGPRDRQGRSLYQLDLKHRLLRYPCSWLIYSESFDRMPKAVYSHVANRMWEVLSHKGSGEPFVLLEAKDRQAIFEILRQTKPKLAQLPSNRA